MATKVYTSLELTSGSVICNTAGDEIYLKCDTIKTINGQNVYGVGDITIAGGGVSLGETSSTAHRGDHGKVAYDHSQVTHDKTLVGLSNVDNTADSLKPISTATQTALDLKSNTSHTHTIDASGFDGNLATSDATLQEVAQKLDDFTLDCIGYTNSYTKHSSTLREVVMASLTDISTTTYLGSNGAGQNVSNTCYVCACYGEYNDSTRIESNTIEDSFHSCSRSTYNSLCRVHSTSSLLNTEILSSSNNSGTKCTKITGTEACYELITDSSVSTSKIYIRANSVADVSPCVVISVKPFNGTGKLYLEGIPTTNLREDCTLWNSGGIIMHSSSTDVISTPHNDQALIYCNGKWVPKNLAVTLGGMNELCDIFTDALYNIGIGINTFTSSPSGSKNIALGIGSLQYVSTGCNNVAVGFNSAHSIQTGKENVAIGNGSMYSGADSKFNVALGAGSLSANGDKCSNVAIGHCASENLTGHSNVAVGACALSCADCLCYHVSIGTGSTCSATSGIGNVSIGYLASAHRLVADTSVVIGYNADSGYNSTGTGNVIIGSGTSVSTAESASVVIGNGARSADGSTFSSIAIGSGTIGNGDNTTTLGNAYTINTYLCGRTITPTLTLSSLPTVDPVVAGQVWNDSGALKISAG